MPITALYAGLLGLLLVVLSIRVIAGQRAAGVGTGDDATLERRVRAQANLAEYAPMGLILLSLLEAGGTSAWALHALGGVLLAWRLAHGFALGFTASSMPARVADMVATFAMIAVAAAMCLRLALFG